MRRLNSAAGLYHVWNAEAIFSDQIRLITVDLTTRHDETSPKGRFMRGETDLTALLAKMNPYLRDVPFVFCTVEESRCAQVQPHFVGLFRETEGMTVILAQTDAQILGLAYDGTWAMITLRVHSALSAVGFLAVVTEKLAEIGLSANPVSAFYHDHLFVPWDDRMKAMAALREIIPVR